MDKSVHLVTLEKLKTALSSFDMSFGVSNRLFRLAIVSEILDTTCLFEQLLESWKQRLPFGEGPDADVDFDFWKDMSIWSELQSNAQQNVCIDNYPLDMGNGLSSEDLRGKRRKTYAKNLKAALKSASYADSANVVEFAKLLGDDNSGMMTFGNMVFSATHSLHSVLGKIQDFLNNPPEELFQSYYEQQKERFSDEINLALQKTKDIMRESITEKRKINRLKEMCDGIVDALRESDFLTDLKRAYTHYDVEDYRDDNNCQDLSDDIVLERLVLEDLLTDDMQLDRKKIAKHIYEHRKTMSRKTISSFYIYAEVIPEIERLLAVLKDFDTRHDSNINQQQKPLSSDSTLSASRQSILNQLLDLADKGEWAKGVKADDIKAMLKAVLGQGETQLTSNESNLSETLWQLLENGRGDRVAIVWQNIVGYLDEKGLFYLKGSPALNKDFFGNEKNYSNIDKGRPRNQDNGMSSGFREILPLLDTYVPKVDKKA